MRIAVAGSSGLIGNALVNSLRAAGHTVTRLVRREARADDEFSWDPETIGVPPESLDGVEAVVSLGGVGVGDGRWTGRFKQELRDSRITPTELLAEAVRDLGANPPMLGELLAQRLNAAHLFIQQSDLRAQEIHHAQ